jgi:hypothetical protein
MAARPSAMLARWPGGNGLNHDVAQCRCLAGAGDDDPLAGVGREAVEQRVLAAAAYDTDRAQMASGQFIQRFSHRAIAQRQAFQTATDDLPHALGHRLVAASAEILDGADHVGWVEEIGRVRIDQAAEWFSSVGLGHQIGPTVVVSRTLPLATTRLHQGRGLSHS